MCKNLITEKDLITNHLGEKKSRKMKAKHFFSEHMEESPIALCLSFLRLSALTHMRTHKAPKSRFFTSGMLCVSLFVFTHDAQRLCLKP